MESHRKVMRICFRVVLDFPGRTRPIQMKLEKNVYGKT